MSVYCLFWVSFMLYGLCCLFLWCPLWLVSVGEVVESTVEST